MLERVAFENYRCLRKAELRLGPLTVLVGPNASGKSSVLKGLSRARVRAAFGLADFWRQDKTRPPTIITSPPAPADASYVCQPLRLDLARLRQPNQVQYEQQLAENGGNLANILATLTRKQQDEVARQLSKLVPVFADVDVRPTGAGYHQVVFEDRWQRGLWYSPREVSDGTLITLAFVLLQHQSAPVDLVTIEEPERGLHPYLLGQIVALLRGLTDGTIGPRRLQIVTATHSAELLDHLAPEEVRFLRRSPEDGSVTIEEAPTDTPEWRKAYDEYQQSLGGLWLSGNLGGVPGT